MNIKVIIHDVNNVMNNRFCFNIVTNNKKLINMQFKFHAPLKAQEKMKIISLMEILYYNA